MNADKGHTAGLADITARPDLGEELLPCPFCGKSAELRDPQVVGMDRYIHCPRCLISIDGFYHGDPGFITAWNQRTRPHDAALAGKLAEALGECRSALISARNYVLAVCGTKNPEREEAIALADIRLAEWEAGRGE